MYMTVAEGIANTCHEAYNRSMAKLAPESFRFQDAVEARALKNNDKYYILRPETVESYFTLWRLTKNPKYRKWGWEVVQVFIIIFKKLKFDRCNLNDIITFLGVRKTLPSWRWIFWNPECLHDAAHKRRCAAKLLSRRDVEGDCLF